MAGRNSTNKQSRNGTARRCGVVMGGALGAFVAAAAMATGSAAPAKADFEELLDPIIQPLLTSVTDSLAGFDPTLATDLTGWTDSLFASLNSIDLAVPSAAEPAAALPASDVTPPTTAYIPLTMQETTEPTVNASIDGSTPETLLVDTGSSGLVIPISDLGLGLQRVRGAAEPRVTQQLRRERLQRRGGLHLSDLQQPAGRLRPGWRQHTRHHCPGRGRGFAHGTRATPRASSATTPSRTFSPVTIQPAASWASGTIPVVGRAKARSRRLAMTGVTVDEPARRLDCQ